ncbi:hypothetical protein [Allorhizocola rhizosphaerae]|uniref:hypothetical protein n=1 Tax=Allorhizocola rhizosphaerae TaxID=1872709 RepID=UPI000E3ED24D|nr:hypothetical protein [Allorhizocola rhizosphaerae]
MEGKAVWRLLPAAAAVVATFAVLIATDTSPRSVAFYAFYWAWCVVLPGTLVYRAVRAKPHSLVDDLAMGAALGLVLEMAVFAALAALDLRGLLILWPVPVVALTVGIGPLRRRVLARGGTRAPLSWSWTVAGIYLFLLGYLALEFFVPVTLTPAVNQLYHIDLLYLLGIVTEAKHHFPLQMSQVAGEPLLYHWFSYAHMAVGSLVSGVDAPTVMFRTGLPPLYALAVVLMAVAGWRVSGRPWVGAGAAALTFVVGELAYGSLAWSALGGQVAYTLWSSPSVVYGYIMGLALIVLAAGLMTRFDRMALALLVLFAFAAPGAKSTVLPVMLCAIGLVCLVQLVRRRFTAAPWLIAGIVLVAQVAAVVVLYGFDDHALTFNPLRTLDSVSGYGRAMVLVAFLIYWGARLMGIPLAIWLRGHRFEDSEWMLLGGTIAGFSAALLMFHPSLSQLFFLRAGFIFGAILSAIGVAALVDRLGLQPRQVWHLAAGAGAISLLAWLVLRTGEDPLLRSGEVVPRVFQMALLIGIAAAIVLALGFFVSRRWPGLRRKAVLGAVLVVLGGGLMSLPSDAYYYPNMRGSFHQHVSAQQLAAAAWIRANTGKEGILATNGHCVTPPAQPDCLRLSFWISAFAERRVLLEGWGYAPKMLNDWKGPYCDADLQRANDGTFTDPTPATVHVLWRKGVRTLVVDRRYGRESAELANYAQLVWEREPIAIYELLPTETPDAAPG